MMKTKVIDRQWVTGFKNVDMSDREFKYKEPTVGWSSVGQVSLGEARDFANRVLKACEDAENDNFDY